METAQYVTVPPGVGKSHLAQALAHEACRRGYEVLFINTDKMLTHLAGGRADGTHEQRLARYTRPDSARPRRLRAQTRSARPGPRTSTTSSTSGMNGARFS